MDNIKATAANFLDTRRERKGGLYPIKISVYYNREKKRYKTGINISEENWLKINSSNLRDDNLKITKRKLLAIIEKANLVIDSLEVFSFDEFELKFFEEKKTRKSSNLNDLFNDYIMLLEKNDSIGTAICYKTTINSINNYKRGLKITDVTKEFLIAYESYLMKNNLSSSTASMYLRQLRRIVNLAINQGVLSLHKYPFRGFVMPHSRNVKKALTIEQIKLLLNYKTEIPDLRKALDYWLFSYASNGMNMTDICLLRPENLDTDFFYFHRAKTKNTKKKDLRPIKVPLTDLSRNFIEKYRNRNPKRYYLFPVLEEELNAKQIKYKIQDFIYFVNKNMKIIGKDLGIEMKLGTYVARHTHATLLKRMGAPTELIKENLGHSSVLTTESYLDDFTDDYKKDFANLLTQL